jgi:hypothetical protein
MTHPTEGLVAPEGVYLPTYSYLLPPPPAYPPPIPANTGLLAYSGKDATTSANTNGSGGSVGSATGATTAAALAAQSGSSTSATGSSGGASTGLISGDINDLANLNADGDQLKTALHHISLQAPSAWSHVPIVPPSKISVASIRLPASTSRRDRQQSASFATAAEVQEPNNESDSSLSVPEAAAMTNSASFDPAAPPSIGPVLEAALASQGIDGPASHVTGGAGGLPGMAALQLLAHLGGGPPSAMAADLASGIPNSSTSTASRNLPKPKNNIKQTSSSFVQRLQSHNDYTKIIGGIEKFAFISRGRIIYWLGESANGWVKVSFVSLRRD